MKTSLKKFSLTLAASLLAASAALAAYETVEVQAPFPMQPIKVFVFPKKDFNITAYGAARGDKVKNTRAIARAIEACSKAGGGRVVVPAGEWLTGAVHLKSNVNLHLEEGAVLNFSDNPADYLPAVMTSWEGLECYNYSPLVYAFDCQNVAITGRGTLRSIMDTWRVWFERPQPHLDALKQLYAMASADVPVQQRQMAQGENNLRPHLIHFNRCSNVLLEDFKVRNSPFWAIHLYLCNGGVVRNLDVYAHGHNNDGVDLEMSRNFLIERCLFDQGDDAVVIKAGRNRDAWRLNAPCENIVIRHCIIKKGHALLGIGSELSGGVRNVYMHDCTSPDDVFQVLQVKTNHRRGGFVENIYVDNVEAGNARRVVAIYTDVMYQWRLIVPTYEVKRTRIEGVYVSNVKTKNADVIYELRGDKELPVRNVSIRNVQVEKVNEFLNLVENIVDLTVENVTYTEYAPQAEIQPYTDGTITWSEK